MIKALLETDAIIVEIKDVWQCCGGKLNDQWGVEWSFVSLFWLVSVTSVYGVSLSGETMQQLVKAC